MSERWSVPRGKKIQPEKVDVVFVKKPRDGADYNKCIRSTLYSPASQYLLLSQEEKTKLHSLDPKPSILTLLPEKIDVSLATVQTKFGNLPKGSVLSYQQKQFQLHN